MHEIRGWQKRHDATDSLCSPSTAEPPPSVPSPPPVSNDPPLGVVRHAIQPRSSGGLPHPSTLGLLRTALGDQTASFTCPEQALALELTLARESSIFLIGSTGMGKSYLLFISARLNHLMVTIVVIPLSGLRIDFAMRCKSLSIPCTEWSGRDHALSTIVMVSPERATDPAFLVWARNLQLRGVLNMIAYDEVHLIVTHADFRNCFDCVASLTTIRKRAPPSILTFRESDLCFSRSRPLHDRHVL